MSTVERVLNPFLDKRGAVLGSVVMVATVVVLLALNAVYLSKGGNTDYYVTLPAAFVVVLVNLAGDWLARAETRMISQLGQRRAEARRAEIIRDRILMTSGHEASARRISEERDTRIPVAISNASKADANRDIAPDMSSPMEVFPVATPAGSINPTSIFSVPESTPLTKKAGRESCKRGSTGQDESARKWVQSAVASAALDHVDTKTPVGVNLTSHSSLDNDLAMKTQDPSQDHANLASGITDRTSQGALLELGVGGNKEYDGEDKECTFSTESSQSGGPAHNTPVQGKETPKLAVVDVISTQETAARAPSAPASKLTSAPAIPESHDLEKPQPSALDQPTPTQQAHPSVAVQRVLTNLGRPQSELVSRPATSQQTLLSRLQASYMWCQQTLPTVTMSARHLPFYLVPFSFSMFILVEALVSSGWIPAFAHVWHLWATRTGTVGCICGMGFLGVMLSNVCVFDFPPPPPIRKSTKHG